MADDSFFDETPLEEEQPLDLFPTEDDPVDPDKALEEEEDLLDDSDEDLTIEITPAPAPLGRSWAFNFQTNQFVTRGHGPAETRLIQTLKTWIVKCLLTNAEASPVHPAGYGLENPLSDYLAYSQGATSFGELEEDIKGALTFHPAITDVLDFEIQTAELEDGTAAAEIAFRVVLDDGTSVDIAETVSANNEVL